MATTTKAKTAGATGRKKKAPGEKAPGAGQPNGMVRNLKGGSPPRTELGKYRFLLARDAASALGKDEGNFSKEIHAKKVQTEAMQIYVLKEGVYFPVGVKQVMAVDMSQFKTEEA